MLNKKLSERARVSVFFSKSGLTKLLAITIVFIIAVSSFGLIYFMFTQIDTPTATPTTSPSQSPTASPTITSAPSHFPNSLSTMKMGDTISLGNLDFTLISWRESDIAVDGPYMSGYYTFTAQTDMKFIIVFFKYQNNGVRAAETPYIHSGEVFTSKGYFYDVWSPLLGVGSTEYNPRHSTEQEIMEFIGDSGGFESLLPEQSIDGCVVFEIPKDTSPIDAALTDIGYIIVFC